MLQNAYFLAKIGADTAENEQHFAEIGPVTTRVSESKGRSVAGLGSVPAGSRLARRSAGAATDLRRGISRSFNGQMKDRESFANF